MPGWVFVELVKLEPPTLWWWAAEFGLHDDSGRGGLWSPVCVVVRLFLRDMVLCYTRSKVSAGHVFAKTHEPTTGVQQSRLQGQLLLLPPAAPRQRRLA